MKKLIQEISSSEIDFHFEEASKTTRRRSPLILHKKGDYLNKVFNFILKDSYMHPHLHPSSEKVEKMYLVKGSFGLLTFDDDGKVIEITTLKEGGNNFLEVPAFTWHTYVMFSEKTIIYETMEGQYNPDSWKKLAPWAPTENSSEANPYLLSLKKQATNK